MLVQVFPYDHRLPALRLLMSGPTPELEPLLLARFGPGDWHTEGWVVEPVRYRVDLRATLRLTARARDAATGRAEERRFYAKVYRDQEIGEQTYQVLRELWDVSGESFTVARPIAYLGSLHILLQEEALGTPLMHILNRKGEDEAIPAARKAARGLVTFHLSDVAMPRRRRVRDETARLTRAKKDLLSACPHLGPEIEEIVGAVVAGLEEIPPAPTHGDVKLVDILLDGDRVVLLDFDKFAGGDPVLDVANLLLPLAIRRAAQPGSSRLGNHPRVVARAFVEEYFARAPERWHARLPLHYAMRVLKKAAGLYRSQVPNWPDEIEALIKEAEDSVAGRVW
jgi:aminoglycoside phosphotransferase (APT) family kinase protein